MKYPETPTKSLNSVVLDMSTLIIDLADFTAASSVDVEEVKDFLRKHPLGIFVLITNDYKNNYKIFCMNSLRLHYCTIEESLYEVVNTKAWPHYLGNVKYYSFVPLDCWESLDILKYELSSHLASLLIDSGKFAHINSNYYFHQIASISQGELIWTPPEAQ
jgi:hypothetical protein